MRKIFTFLLILFLAVFCSACVNNYAIYKLNTIASEYLNEGNSQAAISRLESSVDLDGNIYETRYNLAVAYYNTQQCDKALNEISIAKTLLSTEPAVFYMDGVINECMASNIEIKKNDKDVTEKTVNKINFYKKANLSYENYLRLAPNSDDSNSVNQKINQNNEEISKLTK